MDLTLLRELLPLMATCGVSAFKFEGLEIAFKSDVPTKKTEEHAPAVQPPLTAGASPEDQSKDPLIPQSLDGEMNFDKILNWSSPVDSGPVPLTADEPIGEPSVEAANV